MAAKGRSINKPMSWTRHTSYPSVFPGRGRIPAEISAITMVLNQNAEHEINKSRIVLNKLHKKNMRNIETRRRKFIKMSPKSGTGQSFPNTLEEQTTNTNSSATTPEKQGFPSIGRSSKYPQEISRPLKYPLRNRLPEQQLILPSIVSTQKTTESNLLKIKHPYNSQVSYDGNDDISTAYQSTKSLTKPRKQTTVALPSLTSCRNKNEIENSYRNSDTLKDSEHVKTQLRIELTDKSNDYDENKTSARNNFNSTPRFSAEVYLAGLQNVLSSCRCSHDSCKLKDTPCSKGSSNKYSQNRSSQNLQNRSFATLPPIQTKS